MGNDEAKALCETLLRAETENGVTSLLSDEGLWDKPECWRYYGDIENNWGQSGNQQSLAEAALAEKVVNSIDARLLDECRTRGIDPEGLDAPRSIREAVARFYDNSTGEKQATGGYVEDWGEEKQRRVAQDIKLCATGVRPILNLTIADCGEGQSPGRLNSALTKPGFSRAAQAWS